MSKENFKLYNKDGRVEDSDIAHKMAQKEDPYHGKKFGIFSASKSKIKKGEMVAEKIGDKLIENKNKEAAQAERRIEKNEYIREKEIICKKLFEQIRAKVDYNINYLKDIKINSVEYKLLTLTQRLLKRGIENKEKAENIREVIYYNRGTRSNKDDFYDIANYNFELALGNNVIDKIIPKHSKGWECAMRIIQNEFDKSDNYYKDDKERQEKLNIIKKKFSSLLHFTASLVATEKDINQEVEDKIFQDFADVWNEYTKNSTLKIEDLEK